MHQLHQLLHQRTSHDAIDGAQPLILDLIAAVTRNHLTMDLKVAYSDA